MTSSRTLVAGIGNVFLGDDGFGVEVVRRLAARRARDGVVIADFGIRGFDLAFALAEFERAILVDAAARGGAPGTLYVIDPDLAALGAPADGGGHGIVPTSALSMAQAMGARWSFVRVVGCEPAHIPGDEDVDVGLSPLVSAAVEGAMALVEELLEAADA